MPKRKVFLLITELDIGGAEINLFRLARGLYERSWDVEVAALSGEGEIGGWLRDAGIPVHHVHMDFKGDPIAFARLVRMVRRARPDILHTFLFHANIAGRLATLFARVPVTVSSVRVAEKRRRSHLWMDSATQSLVDREICVSEAVRSFTERHARIRRGKLAVIGNPVEPPAPSGPRRKVRGGLGVGDGDVLVLAVGRLDPQKGCRYLVEAARNVTAKHPRAFFVMAGEGTERQAIERAVDAEGLSNRFRLLGWRPDAADLYSAADIFVLPSLWEGMSNSLLEAAAAGLAIVATDVEGSGEVIRDDRSGLLVPPADSSSLAAAIRRLIEDRPLAQRLGEEARRHVLAKHSLANFIEAHEQLYLQLLVG
ncbi:MAG: glycosyltransferase [Planctomycetota bacterium]